MRERRALALKRCAQRAEAAGLPVSCTVNPFARPRPPGPNLSAPVVLGIAARVAGVSIAEIRSHRRVERISVARHFACWLLRERLGLRHSAIELAINKTRRMSEAGIAATNRRLAEGWPSVISWRNRAAEALSRIDTAPRTYHRH